MSGFGEEIAGPDIGNPAGFIAEMLGQGMSATAGLNTYREAGAGMRTQTWYRLWGEVEAATMNRETVLGADLFNLPRDEQYTEWSAGTFPGYAANVSVQVRDQATDDVFNIFYTHVSRYPFTPQEAIDAAMSTFGDEAGEEGSFPTDVLLGGVITGLFKMTGRQ